MAFIRVCDICGFKLDPEEKQFMFEYRMKKRIPKRGLVLYLKEEEDASK